MRPHRPTARRRIVGVSLIVAGAMLPLGSAYADVTPATSPSAGSSVSAAAATSASAAPVVTGGSGSAAASRSAAATTAAATTAAGTAGASASPSPSVSRPGTATSTASVPTTVPGTGSSATAVATGRQFLADPTPTATGADGLPVFGTLVFGPPAAGLQKTDVPQSVTIKGGLTCPQATTAFTTFLTGPTAEWQATTIVVGSRTAFTANDPIEVNFSNSMNGVAAENNLQLVKGRYDVVVVCFSSIVTRIGEFTGSFWVVEDLGTKPFVDWSPTDPDNTTLTTSFTALTTDPLNKVVEGGKVVLGAVLSPSTAAGTVQFTTTTPDGNATPRGAPVAVTNGAAGLEVTGLPFGLYAVSAKFTPTNPQKFTVATSDTAVFAIVKGVPPVPPTSVAISGTPKVGTAVTCAVTGSFQNASSTGWQWLRDFDAIDGATSAGYTPTTDDRKHLLRCRATGTNSGGTSGRLSPGVAVAS